jgi:deoxycytidylate deaminase
MEIIKSEEINEYIEKCVNIARFSKCKKSKRGVIIVDFYKNIISEANNLPIGIDFCDPCLRTELESGTHLELCRAIHAEDLAIQTTLKNYPFQLMDSTLYHLKLDKKGNVSEFPGEPSCTFCSRNILLNGIKEVVLCGKLESFLYDSEEFNNLSYQYHLNKRKL